MEHTGKQGGPHRATGGRLPDEPIPRISIVIPTLNEADRIASTLSAIDGAPEVEVIVVDGKSHDGTDEIACSFGVRVLRCDAGRAGQMNAGADEAVGDILLFLHADTHLPERFADHVRLVLRSPEVIAGEFRLRIDAEHRRLRLIEWVANWRSRRLGLPYGDQAIFVKANAFRELGGFLDLPIMEDFELMRRLRRRGRIAQVPAAVVTSARRWLTLGIGTTTLINQWVIVSYHLGLSPERLARWYRRLPTTQLPRSPE